MKKKIDTIFNNYESMLNLIGNSGFYPEKIFKGFYSKEERNLCFLLDDIYEENNEPNSQLERRREVKENLENILGIKVIISTKETIDEDFLSLLNSKNSVNISLKEVPKKEIENVFGLDWYFNSLIEKKCLFNLFKEEKIYLNKDIEKKLENIANDINEIIVNSSSLIKPEDIFNFLYMKLKLPVLDVPSFQIKS